MKPLFKYILLLILLNVLILAAGYVLISAGVLTLPLSDIIILSVLFSVIVLCALSIFLRGQTKEPDSQTLHTLISVCLKVFLELVLALIWFIVTKKTTIPSVLVFFILYLALTLFLIWIVLKTLKNKSL